MEIDKQKIEQIIGKLESALGNISRMDLWLPKAIDEAVNGHRGTLDRADIDRMAKEKREEEKIQTEINSLRDQVEESQEQTRQIKKQTSYLMWAFLVAFLGFLFNIVLQISPDLFGLIGKK